MSEYFQEEEEKSINGGNYNNDNESNDNMAFSELDEDNGDDDGLETQNDEFNLGIDNQN